MSGQYKTACYAKRSWSRAVVITLGIKRRRFPGQLKNMRLCERIAEEFMRSRQTYGSPRLAQVFGCPGGRNRIAPAHAPGADFCPTTLQVSSHDHRQPARRTARSQPIACSRGAMANQVWATDVTCVLTAQGCYTCSLFRISLAGASSLGPRANFSIPLWSAPPRAWLSPNVTTLKTLSSTPIAEPSSPAPLTGNCYDNAFIESFFSSLKYSWSIITASPHSPKLALPSSTTSKPSITAPDSTTVLTTKPQLILNPN